MTSELEHLQSELEIQKKIAYTAGLLQGDITIRTLFESLAEGVVVINDLGRIVYTNKRIEQMFGHKKEDLQGEGLEVLIPERYRKDHAEHIRAYFSQPRIRPMGIGLELTGLNAGKEEFPIEVSLSYLEIDTGRLGLAFITDITKRKIAETELIEKNKQLDQVAQVIAHDLNGNINNVVGFSEVLLHSKSSMTEEEKREILGHISSSGRKMSDIIHELLLFARMKREDLEITDLQMSEIVQSAIQRLLFEIDQREAQISLDELKHSAKGYSPWIEEVWFNYISNALKYGGSPPVLSIGSTAVENYVKFWIRDNGHGLSEEDLKLVFEDDNDARLKIVKGQGLGLAIIKNIIEKLGGSVGAESVPGNGSIFFFTLPTVE